MRLCIISRNPWLFALLVFWTLPPWLCAKIFPTPALLTNYGTMPSVGPIVDISSLLYETFGIVHHPLGCPPGPVHTVPQSMVHTRCGVLLNKGKIMGLSQGRLDTPGRRHTFVCIVIWHIVYMWVACSCCWTVPRFSESVRFQKSAICW